MSYRALAFLIHRFGGNCNKLEAYVNLGIVSYIFNHINNNNKQIYLNFLCLFVLIIVLVYGAAYTNNDRLILVCPQMHFDWLTTTLSCIQYHLLAKFSWDKLTMVR